MFNSKPIVDYNYISKKWTNMQEASGCSTASEIAGTISYKPETTL